MEANDMTLDEAIAHCDEVAGACDTECRREHKRLADWLRELKDRRRYQGGNAAATREALEFVAHMYDSPYTTYDVLVAVQKARAALSAPPRNCDVGTAGEQYRRWTRFCKFRNESRKTCLGCPVYAEQNKGQNSTCELIWAQMPYEEGGAK